MNNYDIFCGDCLKVMDELIKKGIKVDMILTDPPYGTTACKWDVIIPFDDMWNRINKLIKSNGAILLFGNEPFSSELRISNIRNYKYDWIWYKNLRTGFANAKYQPMKSNEVISVFYKKLPTYNPQKTKRTTSKAGNTKTNWGECYGELKNDCKPNNQSDYVNPHTVIDFIKCIHAPEKRFHPTQKPVKLLEYLIKTYTNENEVVLDFTMGSGSTGVACINTNRKFIGIELDEKYFEIAKNRIEDSIKSNLKE